jgi:hypothetical protein
MDTLIKKINDIISVESQLIGPAASHLIARGVPGLVLNAKGEVASIKVEPKRAIYNLVNRYVDMVGSISKKPIEHIVNS